MDEKDLVEAQEETSLADTTVGDRDIHLRPIVIFGVVLFVGAAAAMALMWLLSNYFKRGLVAQDPRPIPIVAASPREAPAGPRLQSDPNRDMAALRKEEAALLSSYAWLSADKTSARIPVERAIDILLETGLPEAQGNPAPPAAGATAAPGAAGAPLLAPPAAASAPGSAR